jgi:ubiquitin-activating enzyme E1
MEKIRQDYRKDLRYSRQIGTYGNETMKKLSELKVFIIGLKGLGVEVAKNIILSGPKRVSLYDKDIVTLKHLGTNFYLKEEDIGKKLYPKLHYKSLKI